MSVQVVDTDSSLPPSHPASALLEGSAAAGFPSITGINGVGIAADNTTIGVANVETVVVQGIAVTLGGTGFDTTNGIAVDLFCVCSGGKVGPFFLNPGNAGLSSTAITFTVPALGQPNSPDTGPGSFRGQTEAPTVRTRSRAMPCRWCWARGFQSHR